MRPVGSMWGGLVGSWVRGFEREEGFYPLMPIENIATLIFANLCGGDGLRYGEAGTTEAGVRSKLGKTNPKRIARPFNLASPAVV